MKSIGIIGSRKRDSNWDFLLCEIEFLKAYCLGDIIISGGCKYGGDKFAEILAKKYNVEIEIFYANWDLHGKKAGFLRNIDIAEKSDIIIAVTNNPENKYEGGTGDTIKKAEKMGKQIILVPQVPIQPIQENKEFDPLELPI